MVPFDSLARELTQGVRRRRPDFEPGGGFAVGPGAWAGRASTRRVARQAASNGREAIAADA